MTTISWEELPAYFDGKFLLADAIMKHAVNKVVKAMQTPKASGGRMPVDTGFLRNSLRSGLGGQRGTVGAESYVAVIGSLRATDTATFVYGAEYAPYVNNGARGRVGDNFVAYGAGQWSSAVAEGVSRLS